MTYPYQTHRKASPEKTTPNPPAKAIAAPKPHIEPSLVLALLFLLVFSLFLILPIGLMSPMAFTLLFIGSFMALLLMQE